MAETTKITGYLPCQYDGGTGEWEVKEKVVHSPFVFLDAEGSERLDSFVADVKQVLSSQGGSGDLDASDIKQNAITGPGGERLTVNEALASLDESLLNKSTLLDATATYTDGYFDIAGPPETFPSKFTVRFTAPADYTSGDKIRIDDMELILVTVSAPNDSAPDGAFASGALVSLDVDLVSGKAFFKSGVGGGGGSGDWNIFIGTAPPDEPDGLFAQIDAEPSNIKFIDSVNSEGSWSTLAPLPTARQSLAGTSVGQICYYAGGTISGSDSYSNKHEAYDTVSGLWSTLAPLPTARQALIGTSVGHICYYAGGRISKASDSNKHEAYDTVSGLWSTLAPMPTTRRTVAGTSVGQICYYAGGFTMGSNTDSNKHEAYDTVSGLWSTLTSLPTTRRALAGTSVDRICYYAGGAASDVTNKHEAYDTVSGLWSTLAPMPTARANLAGTSVGHICYYASGAVSSNITAHEAYDTVSGLWSTLAPTPTARQFFAGTSVGQTCYYAGGWTSAATNAHEAYALTGDPYPKDTLVIWQGTGLNRARVYRDKIIDQVLAIKNIFWHNGEKLSLISGKTNVDGEGWKDIL